MRWTVSLVTFIRALVATFIFTATNARIAFLIKHARAEAVADA